MRRAAVAAAAAAAAATACSLLTPLLATAAAGATTDAGTTTAATAEETTAMFLATAHCPALQAFGKPVTMEISDKAKESLCVLLTCCPYPVNGSGRAIAIAIN